MNTSASRTLKSSVQEIGAGKSPILIAHQARNLVKIINEQTSPPPPEQKGSPPIRRPVWMYTPEDPGEKGKLTQGQTATQNAEPKKEKGKIPKQSIISWKKLKKHTVNLMTRFKRTEASAPLEQNEEKEETRPKKPLNGSRLPREVQYGKHSNRRFVSFAH